MVVSEKDAMGGEWIEMNRHWPVCMCARLVRACKYAVLHHGSHLEVGAQTVHFLLGMLLFKFKLLCGILQAHHILCHARILELQLAKAQRSGE